MKNGWLFRGRGGDILYEERLKSMNKVGFRRIIGGCR